MTLKEVYNFGCSKLVEVIEEGRLDAWYLLEYVFEIDRNYYFLHENEKVEHTKWQQYADLIRQRAAHIPLQHLTGEQEFMGLPFYVNEDVLIPRQDTELLVEEAEKYIYDGMKILDMCTGSGCILISLLKRKKGLFGTGADISEKALAVARSNQKRHQVQAEFISSDLFGQVKGKYDMILSNPPYIPTAVIAELMEEVKGHDPVQALDGKEDGLAFYKRIVPEAKGHLHPGGYLMVEIGYDQAVSVSALYHGEGYSKIEVIKDLSGNDRVVKGCWEE